MLQELGLFPDPSYCYGGDHMIDVADHSSPLRVTYGAQEGGFICNRCIQASEHWLERGTIRALQALLAVEKTGKIRLTASDKSALLLLSKQIFEHHSNKEFKPARFTKRLLC